MGGPPRSRYGNRQVDEIIRNAEINCKHQGDEWIELFKAIFLELCRNDGIIK